MPAIRDIGQARRRREAKNYTYLGADVPARCAEEALDLYPRVDPFVPEQGFGSSGVPQLLGDSGIVPAVADVLGWATLP